MNAKKCLCAMLLVIVLPPGSCSAQVFDDYSVSRKTIEIDAEFGLATRRMYRGQNLYDGLSIQPQINLKANRDNFSLYLEVFSHLSGAGNRDETPSFAELDYDLGASVTLEALEIALGSRWLSYSKKTSRLDNTAESYARIAVDTLAEPYFEASYDWMEYRGWYFEFGLSQEISLDIGELENSIIPFSAIGLTSGLADGERPIYSDDGAAYVSLGLSAILYAAEKIYFEPKVYYSAGIDDSTDSEFTAVLSVTWQGGW